jgi:hypothetical protein
MKIKSDPRTRGAMPALLNGDAECKREAEEILPEVIVSKYTAGQYRIALEEFGFEHGQFIRACIETLIEHQARGESLEVPLHFWLSGAEPE